MSRLSDASTDKEQSPFHVINCSASLDSSRPLIESSQGSDNPDLHPLIQ